MRRHRAIGFVGLMACGGNASETGDASIDGNGAPDASLDALPYSAVFSASMLSYVRDASVVAYEERARFWTGQPASLNPQCQQTVQGPCVNIQCPVSADAGVPPAVSAGTVVMQGQTLFQLLDGTYFTDGGTSLWSGGDTLAAQSTGDKNGLPTGISIEVVAPHPVTLTAPVANIYNQLSIDPSQPLVVQWTGGAEGMVVVMLNNYSSNPYAPNTPAQNAVCTFPASASTGTIPPAVLKAIPTNDPPYAFSSFTAVVINESDVVIGNVGVSFKAQINAVTPAGDVLNYTYNSNQ